MDVPANYGVVVYSRNIQEQAKFYMELFSLSVLHKTDELVSLGKDSFNIVLHTPPVEIPDLNFNTVKMLLAVENLEESRRQAIQLGGEALEGEWSNPIFKVCNISDPEGNHIQLRQFTL